MSAPYQKIHVVINPASGKNEPILNTLNDVFSKYKIDWSISVTHKYGDATEFARQAVADGADLVAGYGGDGTQHEIANGLIGTDAVMGVLPGGTGNGFCTELALPKDLQPAVELLCTSTNLRHVDVVQMGDSYFVQRLYVGIEPEQQTSREMKDKYGTLAYAVSGFERVKQAKEISYRVTIDGTVLAMPAMKCYVVNAGKTGTGISVTGTDSAIDDGVLEVFVLDLKKLRTLSSAVDRMLHIHTAKAEQYIWKGKEITIDTDPDQPVWTDGEYTGRTPISVKVVPGALKVVVA